MKFALVVGLVLRRGEKTFELVRQLDEDSFQFEDCLTRRPSVLKRSEILKRIWDRTYLIVLPVTRTDSLPDRHGGAAEPELRIDLGSLAQAARNEIERKLEYVGALQKGHVSRGQRKRIEGLIPQVAARIHDPKAPSASTVMAWARDYHLAGMSPLALRSGNHCRIRARRKCGLMEEITSRNIRIVFLTRDRNSLRHTLDCIRREAKACVARGELAPEDATLSMSTLARRVQSIDVYRRIEAREGAARARMVCRTAMDGALARYPLERVEIDHTPLNWVVICDWTGLPLGRPILTIAIDAFSNYVLGFYLSFYGPGLTSVSGVIRNAVQPKDDFTRGVQLKHRWLAAGVSDQIIIDNGLEFHARSFKLIAWELGSDLMFCRVRTPWLKPHVERFFSDLNWLTLARGRIRKRVANVMNVDPRNDAAIKFSDLVRGLVMFFVDVHPLQINERKLARPYDLMSEGMMSCPPAMFPGDLDALRLASALSKDVVLSPGGVELRGLPYGGAELLPLRKRAGPTLHTRMKFDPDNLAAAWVQDPVDRSWIESPCRWKDYASGLSWNQHLLIRKFARETLKLNGAYEDLMEARLRLHDHWMDATPNRSTADTKLAARFSGATSARVMSGPSAPMLPPQRVIADVEVAPLVVREIPTFDSFQMG